MDWIMLVIAFILGAIVMFMLVFIGYAAKQEELVNRVHFYVVSDRVGTLWLCMGKPVRTSMGFICCNGSQFIVSAMNFSQYGLNVRDFDNLKWEDEPVEVFINMED